MRSTAHWLSWQTGIGLGAAREQVRVARALRDLPLTAAAFASGQSSYSKVRALTRFATAQSESDLVITAQHATGAQIERLAASMRKARRACDVRARRRAAYVTWHQDDDGSIVGSFRLAPEQAAIFCQGLDAGRGRITEVVGEEPDAGADDSARTAADALVAMAEALLRNVSAETPPERGERFQLVLHSTVEGLAEPDDADDDGVGSHLAGANGRTWRLAPSTARRLSCDCPASELLEGAEGEVLHLGRKTRRIRSRLRRAVMLRDGGMCGAPGCTELAAQIHHVRHWTNGGTTCLPNLVSLCDGHHWLVHEGGFSLSWRGAGEWVLISPDWLRVGVRPEPYQPTEPLPVDPAVAPDAVSGHWAGDRLDVRPIVDDLIDHVSAETLDAASAPHPT